jgi:hypothetical protein
MERVAHTDRASGTFAIQVAPLLLILGAGLLPQRDFFQSKIDTGVIRPSLSTCCIAEAKKRLWAGGRAHGQCVSFIPDTSRTDSNLSTCLWFVATQILELYTSRKDNICFRFWNRNKWLVHLFTTTKTIIFIQLPLVSWLSYLISSPLPTQTFLLKFFNPLKLRLWGLTRISLKAVHAEVRLWRST